MIETEYEPVATSTDGTFNLEDADLDGGDHLLVVQATDEDGEVSAYSDETVYSQEHSTYAIEKTTLTAIADSVRAKTGKTDLIPTLNLASEIDSILVPTDTITITENATGIDVSQYATADVAVPIPDGYIQPTDTIEITENATGIDVSQYATADVAVPIPKIIEYPEEITTNGWHYASAVDADGVSKAYINIPTAKLIQEFNWTLQLTLDFSMIPSSLLGSIHWIYFNLPNSGSSDAYIGLHISDGELKAIPISDLTSRVTLYDTNGWATIGYSNIHCAAAVASKVLYDFLGTNYTDRILFSISTTPYQADPGMTWGEWVVSAYNTGGFITSGSNITTEFAPSDYLLRTADGTAVTITEEIIANHAYGFGPQGTTTHSFTVYNSITDTTTSFSFDAGMTWGEWVASDYNTSGYYVEELGSYPVKSASGYNVLDSEGAVHRDDAITANGEYSLNIT